MPDYQFNTNLGPAAQQGTSLGDLINTARGVQAYQQTQEMNPLQLQKARMEIEQAQQINPLEVQAKQTEVAKGKFGLSKEQGQYHGQIFGFLANNKAVLDAEADPKNPEKRQAALTEINGAMPVLKALGANDEILNPLLSHIKNVSPDQYSNIFSQMRTAGQSASEQNQSMVNTETASGSDIYGNPLAVARNRVTGQVFQKPLPFAGEPSAMRFNPGESPKTLEAMMAERESAKTQAGAVSPALQNIDAVRQALKSAQTGRGSEAISNLQSVFGNLAGSTAEEKAAAARDIIQKNIADLALQKNAALGGKYVADLQGAQNSLAEAGKNPTAIAKALDQLEPLLQHAKLYQQGLEKAIQKNGGDVQVKRKFDNAMIDVFDTKALMVYNAYKSGDQKAFANAISGMTQEKKNKLFEDVAKYAKLSNGDL